MKIKAGIIVLLFMMPILSFSHDIYISDDFSICNINIAQPYTSNDKECTSPSVTYTTSDVTCAGDTNGAIDLSISGSSPFTFEWSNSQTTEDITGLAAGMYSVTVTDSMGCDTTDSITVYEPDSLDINIISFSSGEFCNGTNDADGYIVISASGGTTPYYYQWDDPDSSITPDIDSLFSGDYNVTVTDSNGCSDVSTVVLIEEEGACDLTFSITDVTDVSCYGGSDGTASISATSSCPPVQFIWMDFDTSASRNDLSAGDYWITISDNVGCYEFGYITVSEPDSLSAVYIASHAGGSCSELQIYGTIDLTVSGGTPPYTFQWSDPDSSTTEDLDSLPGGWYYVTVTDYYGCEALGECYIWSETGPCDLIFELLEVTDVSCYGGSDGTANVIAYTSCPPVEYLWSNYDTTAYITGLSIGSYIVIATDDKGCLEVIDINVSEPDSLIIDINSTADTNNSCNGAATAVVTGGTPDYNYLWNDNNLQTSQTATGLCTGTYTVIVTDSNGCQATDSVYVDFNSSISHLKDNDLLRIYPNPNKGTFTVELNNMKTSKAYLELYDLTGRIILPKRPISNKTTIDLVNFADGIYFFKVIVNQQIIIKKIIKE